MIKKIVLFLVVLIPVGMMAQDVKLAHVNSQEIIALMPERAQMQTELNEKKKELDDAMEKMRSEYNNKLSDYVVKQKQNKLGETELVTAQSELRSLEQRISEVDEYAQTTYNQTVQKLTTPIITKVQKAIEEVGKENGYLYIFDLTSQSIVYQSPKANDATPLVKKKLGLTGTVPPTTTAKPATK